MCDRYRIGAALGQRRLGRVICSIEIDIGQVAHQPLGPVAPAKAVLFAGHELQRAVHPEMQHNIGAQIGLEIAVKGAEGVGRGKAALEQQAHRVALIAEGGLYAYKDRRSVRCPATPQREAHPQWRAV